jgi:hypothetical protein
MATAEQKEELVEALKGPHFYRITVNGYGGETVFSTISEEAKDFWHAVTEEHGDSDLVQYCISAEEYTAEQIRNGELEFEYIDNSDLTDNVLFLHDADEPDSTGYPWFEPPNERFHNNQADYSGAYMYIEKIDKPDYDCSVIEEVIDGENIEDFVNRLGEESDWEIEASGGLSELLDYEGEPRKWESFDKGDCVFQFHSAEKGTFFEGYLETPGLFNEKKLRVIVDEDAAGNDVVWGFTYDGEEIEQEGGGDTNGKGYYAWVWKQEY